MKRRICLVLGLTALIGAAGCGEKGGAGSRVVYEPISVEKVLAEGAAGSAADGLAEAAEVSADMTYADMVPTPRPAEGVDVDLTAMSGTMVYSEVYNMMADPAEYVGQTVRMAGDCSVYLDEGTGKRYYACIIRDATACCAQGIEFEPADEDHLPSEDDFVTVTGVFDTYTEDDVLYCTLRDAKLEL